MLLINLSKAYYEQDSTRLDTALAMSKEALRLLSAYENLEAYTFHAYLNLMEYEAQTGNRAASEAAYMKATDIAEKQQSDAKRSLVAFTRAVALEALGDKTAAARGYAGAYAASQAIGDVVTMQMCAGAASDLFEGLQNWEEAFRWSERYYHLKDSTGNADLLGQIEALNIQYETEKKDKDLARQSLELSRQQGSLRLMGGLVLLLLTGLGGGWVIYQQRQELATRQIRTLEQEKEISRIRAMVMGEEKERTRIAKDLHDGLGGLLSAAKLQFSALPDRVGGLNDQPAFGQGMELLDTVSQEARRIAHNLMPDILLRLGLAGALEAFCQQISESRTLRVDFEYAGPDTRLPASLELSVYRIVQELINNILKHAGATEALVQVLRDEQVLSITVEDNGQGFAASQEAPGIGLDSIRSRLAFLGGKMDVQSDPGRGASVFVEIILNK
ncbi:MAG: sensor histidine kinase [Bacteroidia bacterium]|nr:sensor histidine kinase [Bacteroidia bacterium]